MRQKFKKVFLCFLAASGVTGEPPAKRRVDLSGELAKRREQRYKEIAVREREMALKEQQLKLDQQKFEAGEQGRRELLKFLMDKIRIRVLDLSSGQYAVKRAKGKTKQTWLFVCVCVGGGCFGYVMTITSLQVLLIVGGARLKCADVSFS